MRVLPDRPCMELIDDWIAEGDEALGACGDRTAGAAIEAWNRALRCLKEDHITPDMTSTAQLAQRLPSRHELGCWLAEMAEACRWATATSVARGAEGLAFTEWALCTWTDEELPIRERLRGARCMIHWALGERDTAVHLFEAWIAEAPERAAPLVGLGELLSFTGSPLNDLERAVALLERAAKSEGTEGLDVELHLDNAVHDVKLLRDEPHIARRWHALPGGR
jgi:hypothetical protein